MTGIVDWAASRARMVLAFIVLSLTAGAFAYVGLPKEGEPDIEIPALFVSVQFPGISAADSETLLVKPMETELSDLDGLKSMTGTAAEGYAGVALEFEFGWNKTEIMADVRDAMNKAEGEFPAGAENYSINEINFSEFPIIIVNLTGPVPERTMARVAKDLQDRIEGLDAVLEAGIAGNRDEMVEVIIDPLRLEAYNITADELIRVVQNNNQLIAAGENETDQGSFAVKIPSSFDQVQDIYDLPIKTNGNRVVTLGDVAVIQLTFEDRVGTARFNGENTLALQVVKRKGYNIIDTAQLVREKVEEARQSWPEELQAAVDVGASNDTSREVASMVRQLEGSVLTAIALVMIVVLAALGSRPALLVGFAIPTSFLLCFVLLGVMGIAVSNIVMFGLILAVGMLVDGAIVVVEYADKRIKEGAGPMQASVEAAKRMFWPIVSSTATTLCAFLPMLFWPGVPGEFMGMLPVTLIFVLSASLIVALVYLPVMGGVSGRLSRVFAQAADALRARLPWILRALLVPVALFMVFTGVMMTVNPDYLFETSAEGVAAAMPGAVLFILGAFAASITMQAAEIHWQARRIQAGRRRTMFGWLIKLIAGNPIMPLVAIVGVGFFVVTIFGLFSENNNGVEFFVETEPERAVVYVLARGNLSLTEKDAQVRRAEEIVMAHPGVQSVFSFAGDGGLNSDTSGGSPPLDLIGQVQFETIPWDARKDNPALDGNRVMDDLSRELAKLPGIRTEVSELAMGPASGKPVHLRIKGDNWEDLIAATTQARAKFDATPGLTLVEDTLPLPGIDWQIDVDVEKAGRFGADVATVGAMVQLVTRGILLDTMRIDSSDEEIDIRVRLPEEDRVLSTLDTLKVRTPDGLIPLSNFITRTPVEKLAEINRIDQKRYFDVKADVESGLFRIEQMDGSVLGYGVEDPAGPLNIAGVPYRLTQTVAERDAVDYNVVYDRILAAVEAAGYTAADLSFTREAFVDAMPGALQDAFGASERFGFPAGVDFELTAVPVNANERIAVLTDWLNTSPFPNSLEWEWTGSWAYKLNGVWEYAGVDCSANSTTTFESNCPYPFCVPMQIQGALALLWDGSGTNGGKAVHLRANRAIDDLSAYGLGVANNGGGTDGLEVNLPSGSVAEGAQILIAREPATIGAYFGSCIDLFDQVIQSDGMNQNGDDAIELFFNNDVIETYGDADVDGTDQFWEYAGSWGYKIGGAFTYGGVDCAATSTSTQTSGCPYPLCN